MRNLLVWMVIVLVVCLAGLVSGLGLFKCFKTGKQVDFKGLGALLVKKLKDSNDIERNFALIKQSLGHMSDGKKKAAEMLEMLRETKTCNDEALRLLAAAKYAGLAEMYGNGRGKAERRIGNMIWPDLEQLIKLCIPYIDKQLEQRASSADSKTKEFMELTRPSYYSPHLNQKMAYDLELAPANYIYIVSNAFRHSKASQRIDQHLLKGYLDELAARGGESVDYTKKRTFEASFKRYLVEACKRFEHHFEPLFDGVYAIASLVNKVEYVRGRSVQFRQLAYTGKVCQAVLFLDKDNDSNNNSYSELTLGFNIYDMLQTNGGINLLNYG